MRQKYDIAFLGGGPAGYQGAIRAAQLGARVAVVEETVRGRCVPQLGLHSHQGGAGIRRSGTCHCAGHGSLVSSRWKPYPT